MIEYFVAAFFVANAAEKPAGANVAVGPTQFKNPVFIGADTLELVDKKQQAIWSGNVKVRRGTTDISCDRLIAAYTEAREVTKIECIGGVHVVDGDRWAKGERAEFDNIKGVLVITGSPIASQGGNLMRGKKVTFDIEKDTIRVDDAKAIFNMVDETGPRGLGGKKGK